MIAGGEESNNYHLVSWKEVCNPKEDGGLGIRNLRLFNRALLAKWCWRFGQEVNSLWRKLIVVKYGYDETRWLPDQVNGRIGCSLWRPICRLSPLVEAGVKFQVGRGDRVKFWSDPWCSGGALKEQFSTLYNISSAPHAFVANLYSLGVGGVQWNLQFRRGMFDWELEDLSQFLECINGKDFGSHQDVMSWSRSSDGVFSVKSMYGFMSKRNLNFKVHNLLWQPLLPSKVGFFMWTAVLEKILTLDNLMKRGWQLPNRCSLCRADAESVNHLLIHCPITSGVWNEFLARFGVAWAQPQGVSQLLLCWKISKGDSPFKVFWRLTPGAVMWAVWKERNNRIFENKERPQDALFKYSLSFILYWASAVESCKGLKCHDVLMCKDFNDL